MSDGHQIFIGYRRTDTQHVVGRIHDNLEHRFGERKIFRDVDSIGVGVPFIKELERTIPKCRVFLALIGPSWLTASQPNGVRRLDEPYDAVRMELEIALSTENLLLVPVLIDDTNMPLRGDLPSSIAALADRNAARVRNKDPDFKSDIRRLMEAVEPYLELNDQPKAERFNIGADEVDVERRTDIIDDADVEHESWGGLQPSLSSRQRRFVEVLDELHVDALRYLVTEFDLTPTSMRERSSLVECLAGSKVSKKKILLALSRQTLVELMRNFQLYFGYNPDKSYMASELLKVRH